MKKMIVFYVLLYSKVVLCSQEEQSLKKFFVKRVALGITAGCAMDYYHGNYGIPYTLIIPSLVIAKTVVDLLDAGSARNEYQYRSYSERPE